MAIGDDALAAGLTLVDGNEAGGAAKIDDHINETRDMLARRTAAVAPVAKGGTGGTTAEAARTNLDVPSKADLAAKLTKTQAEYGNDFGFRDTNITAAQNKANAADANANDRVHKNGDTMTGHLFVPNASAATAGWQNAFINQDGRLCRGSSSERYKKFISPLDPMSLGNIWPAFVRFKMRSDGITPGDGAWHYGHTAESLAADPDTLPFVVWRDIDGAVVPDSINFIELLQAQVTQLKFITERQEARLAALEAALIVPEEDA